MPPALLKPLHNLPLPPNVCFMPAEPPANPARHPPLRNAASAKIAPAGAGEAHAAKGNGAPMTWLLASALQRMIAAAAISAALWCLTAWAMEWW